MGSAFRRAATKFNVENRAHRLLDQQKVRPSPKHPSTAEKIAQFQRENQEVLEQQKSRDDKLLTMLRDVKVISSEVEGKRLMDGQEAEEVRQKARPLPQNRRPQLGSPTVFLEPDVVPEGRLSVGQAMELLARHKRNKEKFTAESLAAEYKMDLTDTKNILEYFQSFKVIPILDEKSIPRIKGS